MLTNSIRLTVVLLSGLLSLLTSVRAEQQAFGLEEKHGNKIPEDVIIYTEDSVNMYLTDIIDKPTLLVFTYYHCPAQCPKMLAGVAELISFCDAKPGVDYQVICLSIDHKESNSLVRSAKSKYTSLVDKDITPYDWRFFTLDSISIVKLTEAAGWEFRKEGDHFAHTTSTVLVSPKAMIAEYFYGTYFNYMHFAMSLEKAAREEIIPTRLKTLKYCYNYIPETNTRIANTTRIFGVGMIAVIFLFFFFLIYGSRRRPKVTGGDEK